MCASVSVCVCVCVCVCVLHDYMYICIATQKSLYVALVSCLSMCIKTFYSCNYCFE